MSASGLTGPLPVPLGVMLGGFGHGDTVTYAEALELIGRPEFVDCWVIVPSPDGDALRLMWGDSCTNEELERVCIWNEATLAALRASWTPSGEA